MKGFFKVRTLKQVMALVDTFDPVQQETVSIHEAVFRVLGQTIAADQDLPGFRRSTMDGYAVRAESTFGASESNPAWLTMAPAISMGKVPDFTLLPGEAAKISTGGMLPEGGDGVVMIEHTDQVGDAAIEVYKSVAPMTNVIDRNEDFKKNEVVLSPGTRMRPQETGLAAAFGLDRIRVFKRPVVGIISTGDEVVPVAEAPAPGEIRDINTYTLAGLVRGAGGIPLCYGIVKDDEDALFAACKQAVDRCDMVLISGGSSVGVRDFTVDTLTQLADTRLLVHGISISPGKPTILARSGKKPVWGLPGHVVSAMVIFQVVVLPFLNRLQGLSTPRGAGITVPARLSRNIASAQGRTDFIRVCLKTDDQGLVAEPVVGKSGLIRTMVLADGLLEIDENLEGLEGGTIVQIIPLGLTSN
ncbi:MAG: molybdopterin molybdotransferase MoeA [Desulfobacterium sp.]|jgi:molybdopterin molybdotransferase|nr:molybdopterin molybdotransferase MoeA [Desulfobacterium sp.]